MSRGEIDYEVNAEVGPFIENGPAIEPALSEFFDTYKDSQISKGEFMSAMELCLRSPHAGVGPHLSPVVF